MNQNNKTIEQLFAENKGRVCHKWMHYLPVYDRFFAAYKNKPINILEVGVSHGGALEIYSDYFHPESNIVGVDIEPLCKSIEGGNIKIFTGSQSDRQFMESIPFEFDIIIDDGSHLQSDIKETFNIMFPKLKTGGLYFVEDLHTAYWADYGGGLRRQGTFIEDTKWMIDDVNGHHVRQPGYPNRYTHQVKGIYITDSIVIIEKGEVPAPHHKVGGTKQIY